MVAPSTERKPGTVSARKLQNTHFQRPGGSWPSGNSQMMSGKATNGKKNSWAKMSAAGPSTGRVCWPAR